MTDFPDSQCLLRAAEARDLPEILEMVRELAEFEHLSHEVVATEEGYREHLFSSRPVAEAIVAEGEEGLVGYAIHFATFSTFRGQAGIWLEDLYVRPHWRGRGLGERLLREVVGRAAQRGAGRCEWCVLDWNERAIRLYERMGGKLLDEWRIVRLEEAGIRRLLKEGTPED